MPVAALLDQTIGLVEAQLRKVREGFLIIDYAVILRKRGSSSRLLKNYC
jgi:hypothetical protein